MSGPAFEIKGGWRMAEGDRTHIEKQDGMGGSQGGCMMMQGVMVPLWLVTFED